MELDVVGSTVYAHGVERASQVVLVKLRIGCPSDNLLRPLAILDACPICSIMLPHLVRMTHAVW